MGFLLCTYPFIIGFFEGYQQSKVVATYQKIASEDDGKFDKLLQDAQTYNENLYQSDIGLEYDPKVLSNTNYNKQLDVAGNGIMGSLDIPKIDVNLPIYHGTGDEALANGVGHIEGTSLPIGGTNSHAVLSGHRGLPSSKLLVRLDEMKKDDYFFIHCGDTTLAYQVIDIQIVEPDNTECMAIQQGKDLISLVTCTPYGINTHRLIVTGEHVTYVPNIYESIHEEVPSLRELAFYFIPIGFVLFALYTHFKKRKWRF